MESVNTVTIWFIKEAQCRHLFNYLRLWQGSQHLFNDYQIRDRSSLTSLCSGAARADFVSLHQKAHLNESKFEPMPVVEIDPDDEFHAGKEKT